jgi:hypothetical protein
LCFNITRRYTRWQDMESRTVSIIIEIIIFLIGLYLIFFKSYFKEKGKILATLEDISQITEKVETVKSAFQNSLEGLRADLAKQNISHQLVYSQLLVYRYKRFDDFFDALIELQNFIKENLFSYASEEEYLNKKVEFFRLYKILDIARFKVNIYISDSFKQKLIDNLNGCYEAFSSFVKMYNSDTQKFDDLAIFSLSAQQLKSKMVDMNIEAFNKLQSAIDTFPKLLTELEDEAKKALLLKDAEYQNLV